MFDEAGITFAINGLITTNVEVDPKPTTNQKLKLAKVNKIKFIKTSKIPTILYSIKVVYVDGKYS